AANGNYFYFRGLASYEHDLWEDFQLKAVLQGQATDNALVDSEQFSVGGLNTVRGYLESQTVGDSAIAGSLELRSPSLLRWWVQGGKNEIRLLGFVDGGSVFINDPLPEQTTNFNLLSVGFGALAKFVDWINGAIYVGIPQITQGSSAGNNYRPAGQPLLVFRVWGEF
ncbi:MAG: BamA/TamA family outer membrane protein, partial [Planctomycetes bacterium]|nr:BamA/TamA family outer membrane protein [Planctomycetota bacterium]